MTDETESGNEPLAEKPQYDQEFFLDLAAKGKDAWNAWRRDPANKDVRVTFAGVDFSEAPKDQIDFSGFEFRDGTDFSGCKWRGVPWEYPPPTFRPGLVSFGGAIFGAGTRFVSAVFGAGADFGGAAVGGYANFTGAVFDDFSRFTGASFGSWANFTGAVFGDRADFTKVTFQDVIDFRGATFGNHVSFRDVTFRGVARFAGAAFGSEAIFTRAVFSGEADFTGMSKDQRTVALGALFSRSQEEAFVGLTQRHEESWRRCSSGPDRFLTISFMNARFYGEADFSGRSFKKNADFTNVRFYSPPVFNDSSYVDRIDLTGARVRFVPPGKWLHRTEDPKIPLRLRALRKIAEELKNHDLERDLYVEERKAERFVYRRQLIKGLETESNGQKALIRWRLFIHWLWIGVMSLYWALSDYGRNFLLPLVWLIGSGFFFYWLYGNILAPLAPKACPLADQYDHAVRMLALGNTVPFIGPLTIDSKIKDFLFCPLNNCPAPIMPPDGYQLAVLFQNLLSIILVFFIGLALRNYFKIK